MERLRVAIIEDEPEFRLRFERILGAESWIELCGSAADAAGGRALIERDAADLYLVDLGLPDGDGRDLIRMATQHRPDVDMLVVTVFGDDAHVIAAIEAGATGYLLKDTEPRQVLDWIRTLRSGGSPLNPVIARRLLQRFRAAAGGPGGAGARGADGEAQPGPYADADEPNPLSARETEILRLLAKGLSYAEIGDLLGISAHTVTQHIKKIYRKLSVHSRGEAVFEATQMGILKALTERR